MGLIYIIEISLYVVRRKDFFTYFCHVLTSQHEPALQTVFVSTFTVEFEEEISPLLWRWKLPM